MASHLKRLRKRHEEGEEWAVSFADMMTLLMCFFILMVSISAVDIDRYEQVAESLGLAMKKTPLDRTRPEKAALTERRVEPETLDKPEMQQEMRQAVPRPPETPVVVEQPQTAPEGVPAADVASKVQDDVAPNATESSAAKAGGAVQDASSGGPSLDMLMGGLEERLRDAGSAVQVERRADSVAVRLHGPVFFALASADLTEASFPFLTRVAEEVSQTRFRVTVEGHTDDLPILSERFPSNWELSAGRAASVARYLIEGGVDASRVEVRGYAHVRPLVPNLDAHGAPIPGNRELNRRVVIVIAAQSSAESP
ncbi:OmpA family protein [Desulfovibrio mangrovi]|uniref:flagellar motor protein MotB n=1 Tax=Desulfovibrio mangrovi TaxID=2976983 RepID=UPI002247B5C8|nr:flagellar motor protein MotB [Desulfovibrio mangrovi]UZP65952.1 OmpA family protein [Desulfovibrio mangrovi]